MWFVSFAPFYFLQINYVHVPRPVEIVLCIFFPNIALGYAMRVIIELEGVDEGLHWYNLFELYSTETYLSVGEIAICLLGNSIIFLLLTYYIGQVCPGAHGVPQKWYFPVSPFWLCCKRPRDEDISDDEDSIRTEDCPWDPANKGGTF